MMNLAISGTELDALLRRTVGWIGAEITQSGVFLKIRRGIFWKTILIERIGMSNGVLVLEHDSLLVELVKSLPPVRDSLKGVSVRMQGRKIHLDFTKPLFAKAGVEDVTTTFEKNRLGLHASLRPPSLR